MRKTLLVLGTLVALAGCTRPEVRVREYRTVADDPRRDTETARAETARAVRLIDAGKLAEAEEALKAALAADLFHGPAHNNLGIVYFRQRRFYPASCEFDHAARLMPHTPEPLNNLGLVFETVGKLDQAVARYDQALALRPNHPDLIGNLARARVQAGMKDARTRALLEGVVLKDTRPDWVDWARETLALMGPERTREVELGAE